MSFQPDSLSDSQLYSLFEELLRRQQSATPRLGTRTFPDLSRDVQARDFSAADLAGLRPYVVSMRQGEWDQSGIFNSTASDVDAIFGEFAEKALADLPPDKVLKLVLYAHGGLVSEQSGLAQAQTHIAWWKQSAADGIYPLYFVWKTGLGETIAQLLGLAGRASRDLATGPRAWISDPIVAGIARRLGGEAVWSGMKRDAEQAVLPNGAATYVARKLKEFYDRHSGRVELHAVGHSAGAVFHSHFIPMSTVTGNPYFTTTSFLAPAVRVDTFRDLLTMDDGGGGRKLKPEIGKLAIFTMKKDFEKRDNCINIYHQSLLYLIYHAFEPVDPTPILGLEESLRSDPVLPRLLGLAGTPAPNADVIWSPTDQSSGCSATQSTSHGGFSSDAPSLNSILRRILGRCNGEPIHPYPGSRGLGGDGIWDIWAPPLDLPGFSPALTATPPSVPDGSGSAAHGSVSPATPPSSANGRRRALCVGIDAYASPNRLTGCVNDAHSWASLLQSAGFQPQFLLDESATYDNIVSALRTMVQSSSPGDVLVFQYSGHGTTVPDVTGRTVDGIEEAMVPVDFSEDNPKLLMDYDLGAIFDTLPAGVNLTCFIDCCHSQTILRMFNRSAGVAPETGDERARFITLSAGEIAAVEQYQSKSGAIARGNVLGGQDRMREVAFAACRPDEVALESGGHGAFTRLAAPLLANAIGSMTHAQFQEAVANAFGPSPQQHPNLDCAPSAKTRLLLQPLA